MPTAKLPVRCAVHQPNFLPRLSTLAKIYQSDVWIVLNDVQFTRRDYQHRTRLARLDDPAHQQWLTLPVHLPHGRTTMINQVRLADLDRCRRRVPALLQQHYRKSPHWRQFRTTLDEITDLLAATDRLDDVAESSTRGLLRLLGWSGRIVRSNSLPARPGRSQRLADLASAVGANAYLCGEGGMRYLDHTPFRSAGITVVPLKTPTALSSSVWTRARRITGLWAVMTAGSGILAHVLATMRSGITLRSASGDDVCDSDPHSIDSP